jgi:hypothetical protein
MQTLQDQLREVAKAFGPQIEVTHQAGYYKARYSGTPSFCFGETPTIAKERLINSPWAKDHRRFYHQEGRVRKWQKFSKSMMAGQTQTHPA